VLINIKLNGIHEEMKQVKTEILTTNNVRKINESMGSGGTDPRNLKFAGLKKEFDVPLTKDICPPIGYYIGCRYLKRIVINIDDILFEDPETGESLQSREQINVTGNVAELKSSFKYKGWLHKEQPLFVNRVKGKSKLFLLRSGFNRYAAAKELGWKYIIVDVYEDAKEPEDQILFKYVVNNDNTPSSPNKDIEFIKGAVEAIDKTGISTDEDVISFLKRITCTSDGIALKTPLEIVAYEETHIGQVTVFGDNIATRNLKSNCLLYKVRRKRGKEAHIRPLDGTGANALLKKLVRGYAGASLVTSGEGYELGYSFEEKNSLHRVFWDGIKLYNKYNSPIMCFGYIADPSSMTLAADRVSCKENFNDFIEETKRIIYPTVNWDESKIHSMNDVPWNIEEIFKWGGFIPQDETMVNGNKKEVAIVN
jgi:hypothetical protein